MQKDYTVQCNLPYLMMQHRLTYAEAGVDIDRKSETIQKLVKTLKFARKGFGAQLKGSKGHYTGLIDFGSYALTLCTDGVGTKLIVAESLGKWKTVGIDCIAMNVNDTICAGAEPIAFVDYIAVDKPNDAVIADIAVGLNKGAQLANVSIVGGETAILPEMVNGIDLSGTALGFVRKSEIITGEGIRHGDLIIGLESSGIHSNGLTLARKVFKDAGYGYANKIHGSVTVGDILLEPTRIYVRGVLNVMKKVNIMGMAHITGGGLRNLLRLKKGVEFRITNRIRPQKIFSILQNLGNIDDREMYQTFNMGMGYCIIVRENDAPETLKQIRKFYTAEIVGEVIRGRSAVTLPELGLHYEKY